MHNTNQQSTSAFFAKQAIAEQQLKKESDIANHTALTYWKSQLEGELPVLELPTDHPRSPQLGNQSAIHTLLLSRSTQKGLYELGQEAAVTPFMILLAVFQTLLHRYTGQTDVIVGTNLTAADSGGRREMESPGNTVALRTSLANAPHFSDLLIRVQETTQAAYDHLSCPFDEVVDALQPGDNSDQTVGQHPVFQTWFQLRTEETLGSSEVAILASNPLEQSTAFDLALEVVESEGSLACHFQYRTELFEPETIGRMAGHFQTLINSVLANPDQAITTLPMLTATEQHQLLVEWNSAESEHLPDLCMHQLFEAQVVQNPDEIALVFGDEQLTYRELNGRANQLAHYLQKQGVSRQEADNEFLVGICLERSIEMIVSVLAIHKAGGAYVPLDPNYPADRIAYMLTDAEMPVVLTQKPLLEQLPDHPAQWICLDEVATVLTQESRSNLGTEMFATDLAYIIYTSGSTGKPKGVLVTHQGVGRLVLGQKERFELQPGSRVLQLASLSFDVSVWEIFMALGSGASLVLASAPELMPGSDLQGTLKRRGITHLTLTPSALSVLSPDGLPDLKFVAVGGEICPPALVEPWSVGRRFFNAYGPTEATVDATYWENKTENTGGTQCQSIPIGRPPTHTKTYVLDSNLQPVPIGVPGELHIGGAGLAKGYLNRLELTEERFIPNPFSMDPSDRIYKSGDLVRYLPDGNIEYFNRIDNQVKIRGFRIELGEIEAALTQHPQIREAAVIVHKDELGGQKLVAYIAGSEKDAASTSGRPTCGGPTSGDLRRDLKDQLPSYMVPSTFITLEALPLTPNGKINRRALPDPNQFQQEPEMAGLKPRNEDETKLVEIWQRILGIPSIGIQDNFFELGGHSLLAVRLFNEIEEVFGQKLPLVTLFQAPTIEALAKILRQSEWEAPWSSLVLIKSGGEKPPVFCIHAVGPSILNYQNLTPYLDPEQPVYGLQAQGLDGSLPPMTRIEDMAAHYIEEIRSVQPEGPYFLVGHSFGGLVAFEMGRQLRAQNLEVGLLALLDTSTPDLDREEPTLGHQLWIHRLNLSRLTLKEKVDYVLERVQLIIQKLTQSLTQKVANNKVDQATGSNSIDLPERYQLIEAADHKAAEDYVPQAYPGKLTLFRSVIRPAKVYHEPELGWADLAAGLDIQEVPGDHLSMIMEPDVQVLGNSLKQSIDEVLG